MEEGGGELVTFGGEREGANEAAVIFARGARWRDQRSLLQSREMQCVKRPCRGRADVALGETRTGSKQIWICVFGIWEYTQSAIIDCDEF